MAETTVPAQTPQTTTPAETREPSRYLVPPVDIYETKDALVVVADMPGVEKADMDVRIENGLLTLRGVPKHGTEGELIREEFVLLEYYRQFTLGEEIDQDNIQAALTHGVMTLTLPKAEKAKPRAIEVKVNAT